jgi:hypothetical protein
MRNVSIGSVFKRIILLPDLFLTEGTLASISQLSAEPVLQVDPFALSSSVRTETEAILTGWQSNVSAGFLASLPALKYIGVRATTLGHVDLNYCQAHGIIVTNIDGYAEQGTAEFVIHRLFEACRPADGEARRELGGKALGLVGLGSVGRRVARIAQAIGMAVTYYTPSGPSIDGQRYGQYLPLLELLESSALLSFHSPPRTLAADSGLMSCIRSGTVAIITTIGLPFDIADLWKCRDRGVRFILDRCAAVDLPPESIARLGSEFLMVHAARTAESIERAESRLLGNIYNYLALHPVGAEAGKSS